ncbi:hypothetical protein GGR53DRAFT_463387 [Hypoxylon sp. FL1150]|nr:hypothetical protein GGR53DRAFT_463387 [Hypoxylon sp. FL1150]
MVNGRETEFHIQLEEIDKQVRAIANQMFVIADIIDGKVEDRDDAWFATLGMTCREIKTSVDILRGLDTREAELQEELLSSKRSRRRWNIFFLVLISAIAISLLVFFYVYPSTKVICKNLLKGNFLHINAIVTSNYGLRGSLNLDLALNSP